MAGANNDPRGLTRLQYLQTGVEGETNNVLRPLAGNVSVLLEGNNIPSRLFVEIEELHTEDAVVASADARGDVATESSRLTRLCDLAEKKGFQAGYAAAKESLDAEKIKSARIVAAAIDRLKQSETHLLGRMEPQVVSLSIRMAEKILHHQVSIDALTLASTVRYLLGQMQDKAEIVLLVSPDDLSAWLDLFGSGPEGLARCKVVADPSLASGMCRIEGEAGKVDFSIEAQLAEINRRLTTILVEGGTLVEYGGARS